MEENLVPLARKISGSAVRRLSFYLRFLEEFEAEGIETVSSEELARRAGTTAAQIRKDLSLFGSFGKRGLGYAVPPLASELREILGLTRRWRIALIGAGRIGSALFEYTGFRRRGFEIVTVFDADPEKVGKRWGDVVIHDIRELAPVVRSSRVEIAVLAVPGGAVQDVADRVVAAGIRGIMSFAPRKLRVPDGVAVNEVNMAVELEALSFALSAGASSTSADSRPPSDSPSAGREG